METKTPTIKGMFVNSHVSALLKKKGKAAVLELEKRYGKSVKFNNLEDVPVKEEIKIIELILDILSDGKILEKDRGFEAGKLHFKNFSSTSYGKLIMSQLRNKFKKAMLMSSYIASQVFKGVKFTSQDLGPRLIKVTMENADYPMDHFKGFFSEWMTFAGVKGEIRDKQTGDGKYEYLMMWD